MAARIALVGSFLLGSLLSCGCTAPTLVVGVLYGVRTPRASRTTAGSTELSASRSARTRVIGFVALELALERSLGRHGSGRDSDMANVASRASIASDLDTEAPMSLEPPDEACALDPLCAWEAAAREDAWQARTAPEATDDGRASDASD